MKSEILAKEQFFLLCCLSLKPLYKAVADPGPSDKGAGGGPSGLKKIFFALRASFWSKNKEGGVPRGLSLDPPL